MKAVLSLSVLAASASAAVINSLHARASYAVKERHPVSDKWECIGDAPGDHVINLQLGLKQSNFPELERHLYEVSDPEHERYGQHLTSDEVDALVRPHRTTNDLVHDWLFDFGIEPHRLSYTKAGDWISIALPVADVERLLDTKYSTYRHVEDDTHLVRTPVYSLPQHLHDHIDTVGPTNSFFRTAPVANFVKRSSQATPLIGPDGQIMTLDPDVDTPASPAGDDSIKSACNFNAVTPKCLRTLYGTINYTPQVPGKNRIGLNNFLNQTNNRSDVKLFLEQYRPEAVSEAESFKFTIIANGKNQQTQLSAKQLTAGLDLEGNLDAETIIGITYPTPLSAFNTGGMPPFQPDAETPTDTNEPYLTWLNYITALNDSEIPQVISTSYADDEQTVPFSYANRVCQQYARLGARGVSLLFGSGDSGVGANGTCKSNDGKNTHEFIASFSSTCPYVTSVSGTEKYPEVVAYDPRNGFAPGGGFSNYFARPSYQNSAVKGYLKEIGSLYSGLYNTSGRAYPDIAAQSVSFVVAWNGTFILLDGTSCATPTASSVLSLVNDALLAAGKPVLGFLNPWLYKSGYSAFTDVTSGSAIGCNTAGFPAKTGWDAVSGFGSPNFPKILKNLGVSS